jgi:drug/metabolite transporter (DMT)-like permease
LEKSDLSHRRPLIDQTTRIKEYGDTAPTELRQFISLSDLGRPVRRPAKHPSTNMDASAHELFARNGGLSVGDGERPASYKIIGISLAIGSGLFIGTSFVLKKYGLLKANEKYNEVAGEGYGYLKNVWWWTGMTLMIVGEICNFVAYAFTDAILVTPLGALSVVITTVLSAIFLKERLSMVGKVSCFLCIVGSVIIVMNAPSTSSVSNIEEMKGYVVAPGFLSYTGVVIIGSIIVAFWAGPKWGNTNMLVYISICSWIGGLSVVATQGLGAAIVAQAGGTPQFNQWFLYIVLVFVIATLLTEIIYLNKALNLFNAALVTPTYYVYFTSTTIITSAVLFRGFKGTATSIVTCVLGFLTICAGVVLLQLSKSAKDVPDAAVFRGDLNQIQEIAEQEEPETEPRADAIRGAAAIVRRFSTTRQAREMDEVKRLQEEKMQDHLEAVSEGAPTLYEWDGIRRRRTTTMGSNYSRQSSFVPPPRSPHPPLGMSRFMSDEELDRMGAASPSSGIFNTLSGSMRRARAQTVGDDLQNVKLHSPGLPVPLTRISGVPREAYDEETAYYGANSRHLGLPTGLMPPRGPGDVSRPSFSAPGEASPNTPTENKRNFSFHNVFKWTHGDRPASGGGPVRPPRSPLGTPRLPQGTEEERLGLVKGDSRSMPHLPRGDGLTLEEESEDSLDYRFEEEKKSPVLVPATALNEAAAYGRSLSESPLPPRAPAPTQAQAQRHTRGRSTHERQQNEVERYEARRARWNESQSRTRGGDSSSRPGTRKGSSADAGSMV